VGRDAVHRLDRLARRRAGERTRRTVTALIVVSLSLATLRGHDLITTRVTWNAEVKRIVQARCVSCHSSGGRAPMALTTYKESRPWARAIKEEVLTRRMPKWHAMRGYGSFSNDPSLSSFEIALIAAWVDGGAPEGPPPSEDAAPTRDEAPLRSEQLKEVSVPCGEAALDSGTLAALQPELPKGLGIGVAVRMPDGRTEPLARIRDFDPNFAVTYWLRRPLPIPAGAKLVTTSSDSPGCRVVLTMARS
jgi:mono/diheme cytochrome c family protein